MAAARSCCSEGSAGCYAALGEREAEQVAELVRVIAVRLGEREDTCSCLGWPMGGDVPDYATSTSD
jgi:hypothetical protein